MSMLPSGKGKCDKCGQLEESTSIVLFLIVNDVDLETGLTKTLYFCRRNQCSDEVLAGGEKTAKKKGKKS